MKKNKIFISILSVFMLFFSFTILYNVFIYNSKNNLSENESSVSTVKNENNKNNSDNEKSTETNINKNLKEENSSENEKNNIDNDQIESKETSIKLDTNLDNTKIAWWFKPNKNHETPEINLNLNFDLKDYDSYYVGDTSSKVLYLTFDEGYENGYTAKILDILKENDVKAVFFVTSPYLTSNPDLIKRMVDEGHLVGNHTNHHPSMPTVTNSEEKFNNEFADVENKFKEITGQEMPKLFRPPMGEYSQKSLAMTKNLGYKTLFWSFAYHDWDIKNQPNPEEGKKKILDGVHNGSIMLLHAVSKTNTEILDSVLKELKSQGYSFELFQ